MSLLNSFVKQLLTFSKELEASYPDVKELHKGVELIDNCRKINPRLIHELFYKYIYIPFYKDIKNKEIQSIQTKISSDRSIHSAFPLFIELFTTHWNTMSDNNKEVIWKYLFILCSLSEKIEERKGV